MLHEIIHGELEESATPLQAFTRLDEASSSSRAERRRSLPSQPSITSLSSLASSISPPEISAFEQKRRRANKLTNFFGVNHRDIMAEILENIEKGVEEDRGNGNLDPEQVKVSCVLHDMYVFPLIVANTGTVAESQEAQEQNLIYADNWTFSFYDFLRITY